MGRDGFGGWTRAADQYWDRVEQRARFNRAQVSLREVVRALARQFPGLAGPDLETDQDELGLPSPSDRDPAEPDRREADVPQKRDAR